MSDRDFLVDILYKINGKGDFVKYISNTMIDYVKIVSAEWLSNNEIKVYVSLLPFKSVYLPDIGIEEYFGFISNNIDEVMTVDVDDDEAIEELSRKLNIRFVGEMKNQTKEAVSKEVERLYQVFKATVSNRGAESIKVDVEIIKGRAFTVDDIRFLNES